MQFQTRQIPGNSGTLIKIVDKGVALSFSHVASLWQSDPEFCDQFNQVLAESDYAAFRWELPGLTSKVVTAPFECVLVESRELLRRPANPAAFEEYFQNAAQDVLEFSNIGRNARLIVPKPVSNHDAYPHLAAFVRRAPEQQRLNLWKMIGDALQARLSSKPVWLSTAGVGVPWLHVRLDDRPKYYSFSLYQSVVKR
ncbi:hypothetical protein GC197_15130 [bacterium]|nr:hypothetical protein [bacterium]